MHQKLYTCPITQYSIEYILDNDFKNAYQGTVICDYANYKLFFQLLRRSIEDLKTLKVEFICQTVTKSDWINEIQPATTTFEITSINDSLYDIKCNIDDFLTNFGRIMGL